MAKPPYTLSDFDLRPLSPQKFDYQRAVIGKPETGFGELWQSVGEVLNKISDYYSQLEAEKKYSDFVSKITLLDYQARKEQWNENKFQEEAEKLFNEHVEGIDDPEIKSKFENFYKLRTAQTLVNLKEIQFNNLKDEYLSSLIQTQQNLLQTTSPFDFQTFNNNLATIETIISSGVKKGFLNKTTAIKYLNEFKENAFDNFAKISIATDPQRFRKELTAGIYDKILTPEKKAYYQKLAMREEYSDYLLQNAFKKIEINQQVKEIITKINEGIISLNDLEGLVIDEDVKVGVLKHFNTVATYNPESVKITYEILQKLQGGQFKKWEQFADEVEKLHKQGKLSYNQASNLYKAGIVYFAPKNAKVGAKLTTPDKLPLVKSMRTALKQEIKGTISYLQDVLEAQGLKANFNPQATAEMAVALFDSKIFEACQDGKCDAQTLTQIAEEVKQTVLLPRDKLVFTNPRVNPQWLTSSGRLHNKIFSIVSKLKLDKKQIPLIVKQIEDRFIEDVLLNNPYGYIRLIDIAGFYAQDGKTEMPPIRVILRDKETKERKSLFVIPYLHPNGEIEWDIRMEEE